MKLQFPLTLATPCTIARHRFSSQSQNVGGSSHQPRLVLRGVLMAEVGTLLWACATFIDEYFVVLCCTTLAAGGLKYLTASPSQPKPGRPPAAGDPAGAPAGTAGGVPKAAGAQHSAEDHSQRPGGTQPPAPSHSLKMSGNFMEESMKGITLQLVRNSLMRSSRRLKNTRMRLVKDFTELHYGQMWSRRKVLPWPQPHFRVHYPHWGMPTITRGHEYRAPVCW